MIVRNRNRDRKDRQEGTALVVTLIATTTLATLSAAVLGVSLSGSKERRGAKEDLRARYVCQAGLSEAVFDLQRGATGNLGSVDAPVAWEGAQYYVARTDLGGDVVQLTATGVDERAGARMELVLRQVPQTSYRYGAFGKEFFELDSNARVDSYDSTLGTYASQATNGSGSDLYARSNGDVGSNGWIYLSSNAHIWGDAPCGPNQTTTVTGNAIVEGSTAPAPSDQDLPAITVPDLPSLGNWNPSGNVSIPPGAWRYGNFRAGSNSVISVTGPATLVFTNFELRSNAQFLVNATIGPVTVYVLDDFILNSNAVMRSTDYDPHDLEVKLLSDNVINPETSVQLDELSFESNTQLYGTIYAPNAAIEIESNFEIFGSMVARSLHMDSNSRLHFDESLSVLTAQLDPDWETICWRSLPYTPPGSTSTGGTTGGTTQGGTP